MKLVSFDVGIKNLALCILETDNKDEFAIRYWDVINLCETYKCKFCKEK